MHKKQKRILLFSIILVLVIVGTLFSYHYVPFNRILKISGNSQEAFINQQHTNTEAPNTLYYDFEVDPKNGNNPALEKGIAHSGQYSAKAFGKNSYSISIERKAIDVGLDNLGAISMSAWVYVFPGKNEPIGSLVFAASHDKINVAWKAVTAIGSGVPRGKWFKISGLFDLSDVTFKPDYKLVFYFWNTSSADFLMDDLYVVFGGPKPRKGDSTLVNLSNGAPFTPKFNAPPYPFHYLVKNDINNDNASFLIKNRNYKEGDISPYDRIYSGHFISDPRSTEDILVINKSGIPEMFSFCRDKNEFREIIPVIPPDIQAIIQSSEILTGNFSGTGSQVLISGPKGIIIGEFDKVTNICGGSNLKTSFKTLLKSSINPFPAGSNHLVTGDFDGNKMVEILSTAEDGSWKLYRFDKGKKDALQIIASGENNPLIWNTKQFTFKISTGRFLQKYSQDLLLTVYTDKSKKGYLWSLLRFDQASLSFTSCFNSRQTMGKTIGLDTLKPGDEFFTGSFDNSGNVKVFRYNHDWRYDLKEIRFNDSTFQILANIDFAGFESDHNPKYFEILKLLPGMLISNKWDSFLVIGKNCKKGDTKEKNSYEFAEYPALPSAIRVFTYQNREK